MITTAYRFFLPILTAAITLCTLAGWNGRAEAAEVNWKMHLTFVNGRPEAKFAEKFAEYVKDETKGRVSVEVFTGGSLGVKDPDTLRWLPPGNAVHVTWLVPEYMSRDAPEYANILPVGAVDDVRKLEKLRPVLWSIEDETYSKWGIKMLSVMNLPLYEMHVVCKQPAGSLADLRNKKMRVFAKFHVDALATLGIAAQVIPQNELYLAMQTGVVDCAYYPLAYATTISLQEVAPYASYIGTNIPAPGNLIVSKKAWDALPADLQKAVQTAADRVEKETWEYLISGQYDKEGIDKYVKAGGRLLPPLSKADQDKIVETVHRVWKDVNAATGPVAVKNYERVKAALGN